MLFIAGGEADIGWSQGGAEGVGGGVNAALVEVEAEGFGHFTIEALLCGDRAVTVEEVGGDGSGGFYSCGCDLGELGRDGVEESGNFAGFGTAFVFREEGIVRFVVIAPVFGFFASDF